MSIRLRSGGPFFSRKSCPGRVCSCRPRRMFGTDAQNAVGTGRGLRTGIGSELPCAGGARLCGDGVCGIQRSATAADRRNGRRQGVPPSIGRDGGRSGDLYLSAAVSAEICGTGRMADPYRRAALHKDLRQRAAAGRSGAGAGDGRRPLLPRPARPDVSAQTYPLCLSGSDTLARQLRKYFRDVRCE